MGKGPGSLRSPERKQLPVVDRIEAANLTVGHSAKEQARLALDYGSEETLGARCGNTARRDLWRGRRVTAVPTLPATWASGIGPSGQDLKVFFGGEEKPDIENGKFSKPNKKTDNKCGRTKRCDH